MKMSKQRFIEALLIFVGDTFRMLSYTLLIIYMMHRVFEVKLNPAFPLRDELILIGAISCALLMFVFRLIEVRWSGRK